MIIMMYAYYFLFMSSLLWGGGSYLFMMSQGIIMEWLISSMQGIKVIMLIYIDWVSMIFMGVVMLISLMILIYSMSYMKYDKGGHRFYYLLMLFILSMLMLVISPNLISMMFGWDGLGLISFLLVVYYQNYIANYSGMVTVIMNRVGDISILIVIGMMMIYGSWNLFFMLKMKSMMMFIVVASFVKSAQFPFSTWLPMAMAAPTPVSALVHSSTLVTAGVYLMIRYVTMLNLDELDILVKMSVFTMFMSSGLAVFEYDLKKVIALSTLSQIGLMMLILGLGVSLMALYHLLVHAIFKSLMFMSVGIILHLMNNNQDIRLMGMLFEFIPLTMISMLISLFSLCGVPFMSGFYSKDLLVEMICMMKLNIFMFVVILISLIFTFMYTIRLIIYLYVMDLKISLSDYKEDMVMLISVMSLILLSVCMGNWLNWMFFLEVEFLSVSFKLMMISMMLIGCLMMMAWVKIDLVVFMKMGHYMSSMMFYNLMLGELVEKGLEMVKIMNKYKVSWFEFYSESMIVNFFFSYSNYSMSYNYKMHMYMLGIVLLVTLMYLI